MTEYVKETNGFRTWGGKDERGNLFADCTCGGLYTVGFQDRNAMMQAVRQHASRHALRVVKL